MRRAARRHAGASRSRASSPPWSAPTPEVFARIKPACEAWAQKVVHLGPVGDGHKMKLLNNFLSMGYAAIYSEALTLAQKIGITPQTFNSVLARQPDGLRLLPDLHEIRAGARPRRP